MSTIPALLTSLRTRSFRSLRDLEWQIDPGFHLLLGGTGEGKTSVLEAMYLAATTRSFRTSQLVDCLSFSPTAEQISTEDSDSGVDSGVAESAEPFDAAPADVGSDVEGPFEDAASRLDLGIGSDADGHGFEVLVEVSGTQRAQLRVSWRRQGRGGLRRRVNGTRTSLSDHLARLPVLSWTSRDLEVMVGAPELRRQMLDRVVLGCRPHKLEVLSAYRRSLDHKRKLLFSPHQPIEVFESWNRVLAEAAVEVAELRADAAAQIDRELASVVDESGLDKGQIHLTYQPSLDPADGIDGAVETLQAALAQERQRSRALVGPHRDRIELTMGGIALGRVASAGERKAIGLLLTVAQARVLEASGRAPVLLVDDADVEMDKRTLDRVFPQLLGVSQLFATSNRPEAWDGVSRDFTWQLGGGRINSL